VTTPMRNAVLGVSVALIAVFSLYALNSCIPFNLTYVKRAKAQHLRDNVKEWEMQSRSESYGHTNQTDASYLWRTNLVSGNTPVSTVMREVFWVGRDGLAQAMTPK
jgi:hypothetical protein